MSSERYVGERRALWHFLSELRPLIVETLGEDALLRHRIDRALKTGDLDMLRHARRIFHNHPDGLKRQLMRGIFEGTAAGGELPATLPDEPLPQPTGDGGRASPGSRVVRFDAFPAASEKDVALSVELDNGKRDAAPVQVMIKPGTLPRSAAEALRQVADWIEHDRRMLSTQHWALEKNRSDPADETVDQA
ncbi:MAG: hypothetical protein OEU92_22130 [Alphaproteobacteria bacterium]|nr:hypothetical protein [Alphaproteobacteria bacterium]